MLQQGNGVLPSHRSEDQPPNRRHLDEKPSKSPTRLGEEANSTNGVFTWMPTEEQAPGAYPITVRLTDAASPGLAADATFTVAVHEVNDAPLAQAQALTIDEDAPLTITLAGSDPEDDPLSFSVMTKPSHGTLTGTPPDLTYLAATDYHGADQFSFRVNDGTLDSAEALVSITVQSVNDLPTIRLTRPVADAQFIAPATVELEAEATDVDGTIAKVAFFEAAALLGEATAAPYLLTWSNVVAGSHVVTARAVDDEAGEATSTPLTISVLASLRSAEVLADGSFRFRLAGEPGQPYVIEVSENLVSWTSLQTNTVDPAGWLTLTETLAGGFSNRYYRARLGR